MTEQQLTQHAQRHWASPVAVVGMWWTWARWWIVGLARFVGVINRWRVQPESLEWVTNLAATSHASYMSASVGYQRGKRARTFVVVAVLIVVGWNILHARNIGLGHLVAWFVISVGLAAVGHWRHRPHVEAAIEAPQEPDREQERVAEALAGRLAGVREPDMLRISQIRREWTDVGTVGRSFTVGLPLWIEAAQVAANRAVIAAALSTRTDRITVTEGDSPNQAIVFVADISPSEMPAAAWPLIDATSFDLTQPLPIGQTPDGRPAELQLFSRDGRGHLQGHHLLLTGMSGYGKSTLLQLILSASALDDRAVLNVAVLKDTHDFDDIEPALSYFGKDASLDEFKAMLARAVDHMGSRAGVPYLVVIDECQEALGAKGDPEAREMVRSLLAKGRSAGIALILVTQEPTGPNLEPDLARRPQNRISFWQSQNETADRAMGSGMTETTNPAKFGAGDQGLAAVIGTNGFRGRVKTPQLDPDLVARIANDHRREPVEAEFPTYAFDHDDQVQDPEPAPDPTDTIVHHIAAAWDEHLGPVDRVSPEHLAYLLAELDPRYYGVPVEAVKVELRGHGVELKSIKGLVADEPRKTSRGYYRADIDSAAARGVSS